MSSIPTQHFNGDTSFGRNTYTGGNVTVRGNSKICRNLLVQGWLDAPNLKSPYKGLFPNADLLNSLYATPRPGWWALVGTILPAELWVVNDGSWVNTGNMVDAPGLETQLNLYLEDFAAINGTIEALSNRIDALVGENASEAIDNFNEILAFLAGMSDDTTLAAKLDRLRNMDIVHIHMFNGDDGTAHLQLCTVGDRTYTAPMHTATDYRDGVLSAVDFKRFDDACRAVDGGMPVRRVTEDGAEGIITPGLYWVSSGEAGHGLALLAVTRNPSSMPGALSYTVTQHRLAQGALMVREGVVRQVAGPSPALTVDWGEWGASGGNPPDISDFERRLSALEQGVVAEVPELTAEDIERIYAGLQQ